MKSIHILVLLVSLVIGGCSSTADELRAAFDVCEPNGGLDRYEINHSAVCKNGAIVSAPLAARKLMREAKVENKTGVRE